MLLELLTVQRDFPVRDSTLLLQNSREIKLMTSNSFVFRKIRACEKLESFLAARQETFRALSKSSHFFDYPVSSLPRPIGTPAGVLRDRFL